MCEFAFDAKHSSWVVQLALRVAGWNDATLHLRTFLTNY